MKYNEDQMSDYGSEMHFNFILLMKRWKLWTKFTASPARAWVDVVCDVRCWFLYSGSFSRATIVGCKWFHVLSLSIGWGGAWSTPMEP